ncbi:hypothetical protein [Flavobacterium marginilacus]|uniref:hypothetical protein n=1 Tax=Flavobacterium marginilacus TaxID=3003256 RepID=UPI00248DC28E|nr:hypothetical protein [Flavobacterium marginilacus]
MKNTRQKLIFTIALSLIFMIGASNSLFAQKRLESNKFLILIETTNDSIKLTSRLGCSFNELKFTLKTDDKKSVDQHGINPAEKNSTTKTGPLANFLFTIKKTEDGLSFEGIKGTSYKEFNFSCTQGKCHLLIDQNGLVELH